MSVTRVLVGAVAAIGGYLFIIAIAFLAKSEALWLPYAAELAGALVAAGALARQGAAHKLEALAAGALSVVIVGAVAFTSPHTYSWVAARSDHPWLVAIALLIGCGAASYAGARLAYGRGGMASIVVLSTVVSSGFFFFGMRLVTALLAHVITNGTALQFVPFYVCAFLAGLAVQWVVSLEHAGVCASGVAVMVALLLIDTHTTEGAMWLVLAVVAAFVGALVAQKLRRNSGSAA